MRTVDTKQGRCGGGDDGEVLRLVNTSNSAETRATDIVSAEGPLEKQTNSDSALRSPPLLATHDASRLIARIVSSLPGRSQYSVMASVDGEAAEREEVHNTW